MALSNPVRAIAFAMIAVLACQHHDAGVTSSIGTNAFNLARQPQLGSVVTATKPPPPISGGTLTASKKDPLAVASDPDRDRIYVVDLAGLNVRWTLQLAPGAEPGRVELDEQGFAHVILRGTNQLASIDLARGSITYRSTCTAPRGVAYDQTNDALIVTCAVGDMMSFPRQGDATRTWKNVGEDLRDVVITNDGMRMTDFRKARIVALDENGASGSDALPDNVVAWRARAFRTDSLNGTQMLVTSQDTTTAPVSTDTGGYGNTGVAVSNCLDPIGIVSTRLWLINNDCSQSALSCLDSVRLPGAVLPVDVATDGSQIVVVAAGNAFSPMLPQLFTVDAFDILGEGQTDCVPTTTANVDGQATAADFSSTGDLLVQTREPAQLHIMTTDRQRVFKSITLATESVADTGHEVFHANSGGNIACASCHAEGGDDSHTWTFDNIGARRTPSLRGTVQGTAPYHWNGDQQNMTDIVNHVFVKRMSGPQLDRDQIGALQNYLFALPPPPQLRAPDDASARGQTLFGQRCVACHTGTKMTDNATIDVGTGGKFQVPSLVGVGWRGPWIHNGCAETLEDRFGSCGGDKHADLSGLSPMQIDDIVSYLQTL